MTDNHPNAPRANGNGYAKPYQQRGGYRHPAAPAAPCWKDEVIWTQGILQLIAAGEVRNDKTQIWETIKMLRLTWRHTFGANGGAP